MPFAVAMVLRIVFGRNRLTSTLISVGTMWFLANVLMAPYSVGMRQDLQQLPYIFR